MGQESGVLGFRVHFLTVRGTGVCWDGTFPCLGVHTVGPGEVISESSHPVFTASLWSLSLIIVPTTALTEVKVMRLEKKSSLTAGIYMGSLCIAVLVRKKHKSFRVEHI